VSVFLSNADKEGGDSSDADVRTLWYKKLQIFRNSWCPLVQGELIQSDILRGGGQFFTSLCGRFHGRLLFLNIIIGCNMILQNPLTFMLVKKSILFLLRLEPAIPLALPILKTIRPRSNKLCTTQNGEKIQIKVGSRVIVLAALRQMLFQIKRSNSA